MKNSKSIINKLGAIGLLLIGLVPYWLDKDITAFLFFLGFAAILWFEDTSWSF